MKHIMINYLYSNKMFVSLETFVWFKKEIIKNENRFFFLNLGSIINAFYLQKVKLVQCMLEEIKL